MKLTNAHLRASTTQNQTTNQPSQNLKCSSSFSHMRAASGMFVTFFQGMENYY